MSGSRYASMFRALKARHEGAFGAFLMLGDPSLEASLTLATRLVKAGADFLELGIAFSDPIADGPIIQAASQRALCHGATPEKAFACIKAIRARVGETPIGILTYANLAFAQGVMNFYVRAAEAGADSVLLADVPASESEPFVAGAQLANVAPVLIAASNTSEAHLRKIGALSQGFVYCVSRPGVTGVQDGALDFSHQRMLLALRRANAAPAIFGFGISTPQHVRAALDAGAEGVVSGSAIVQRHHDDNARVEQFVRAMKAATAAVPIRCTDPEADAGAHIEQGQER